MTKSASPNLASQAAIGRIIRVKHKLLRDENKAVIKSERASASKSKRTMRNCFRWEVSINRQINGKTRKYKGVEINIIANMETNFWFTRPG